MSFVEVMAPVTNSVPPVTVGVAVPPMLLKVTEARVFWPTRVSTLPPLSVTLLVEAMDPLWVTCVALALFRIRLPGTMRPPSWETALLMLSVPWLTTVSPV